MVTDPIGDFINRIKNAGAIGKESVVAPYTKLNFEIAKVLEKEGFLEQVERRGRKIQKNLEVTLSYENNKPKLHSARRISKPSRRVYVKAGEARPVRQGFGRLVLSTPKGILTGEEARKQHIGGEALLEVW